MEEASDPSSFPPSLPPSLLPVPHVAQSQVIKLVTRRIGLTHIGGLKLAPRGGREGEREGGSRVVRKGVKQLGMAHHVLPFPFPPLPPSLPPYLCVSFISTGGRIYRVVAPSARAGRGGMNAEGRTKDERREAKASLGMKEAREEAGEEEGVLLSLLLLVTVVVDLYL